MVSEGGRSRRLADAANLIPQYLGLGIPIGLMLGVLLAFRRLALSSELDALRAVGLGYGRLLRVPYLFAAVLMLANLFIVGFVQPRAEYAYEGLRFELRSGALGASIRVGEFTNLGRRMTLRVERSEKEGTDLHGVFLRAESRDGPHPRGHRRPGSFLATDDPNTILFRLSKRPAGANAPVYSAPRVLSFRAPDLPIDLPAIDILPPPRRGAGARPARWCAPGAIRRRRPQTATRCAPTSTSGCVDGDDAAARCWQVALAAPCRPSAARRASASSCRS